MRLLTMLFAAALLLAISAATPAKADEPDFSAFTGRVWFHHTTRLWVDANGLVTEFDHSANPRNVDISIYAQLVTVVEGTAYGYDMTTGEPVWLVLLPYDMVLYENTLTQIGSVFCDTNPASADWTNAPGMRPGPCGV